MDLATLRTLLNTTHLIVLKVWNLFADHIHRENVNNNKSFNRLKPQK